MILDLFFTTQLVIRSLKKRIFQVKFLCMEFFQLLIPETENDGAKKGVKTV